MKQLKLSATGKRAVNASALHKACYEGNAAEVKKLLQSGVDGNQGGSAKCNKTPLQLACKFGSTQTVQTLLDFGVDPNRTGVNVRSPFNIAIKHGNLEVVKLLATKVDLNGVDSLRRTPLSTAAAWGHFEIIKFLVQNGANLNTLGRYGKTPLANAVEWGYIRAVEFLIESGATMTNEQLCYAALSGHLEISKFLMDNGAEINCVSASLPNSPTPLCAGIESENLALVTLLLQRGADPNLPSGDGWLPLGLACYLKETNIVKLLLKYGADPDLRQVGEKETAICEPLFDGAVQVVKTLLDYGANVNGPSTVSAPSDASWEYTNTTYLHRLVSLGDPCEWSESFSQVLQLLVQYGADVNAVQQHGRFHEATEDQERRFEVLYRDTPLHVAILSRLLPAIRLLIDAGANLSTPYVTFAETKTVHQLCEGDESLQAALVQRWTPKSHKGHPSCVKDAIFCVLLIARRQQWNLGEAVMHKIFAITALGWTVMDLEKEPQ